MLDHISCGIPPVVENLTSKDMSANTPDRCIVFFREPLVAQFLSIEVVNLERAVVHMCCRVRTHEERVVIDGILATIDVGE